MTKEAEAQATPEAEGQATELTPEPEATPKTFTQQDLDDLKAELNEETERRVAGLNRAVNRKEQELEAFKKQPQSSANAQLFKELISTLEAQTDEYGKPSPQLARMKATVARMEAGEKKQQAAQYWENENQKLVQEAEEAGLDTQSAEFDTVINAFIAGDPNEARRRLQRAIKVLPPKEQKVEDKKGKKAETEEQVEERLRAKLVKELTKQDTGSPSGAGYGTGGLKDVLGGAKNPREAYQVLNKFTKGA